MSANNAISFPTSLFTTNPSLFNHAVALNNATNNPSDATAPSGSKRKADPHESCSGPNLKKARVLPTFQEPSGIPVTIPRQIQEPQATVRTTE